MPATKHRRNAPPPEQMDVSLACFAGQIDEHLGRATGFAEAVATYRAQTDLGAVLDSRSALRTAVHARLDANIAAGAGFVDRCAVRAVRRGGTRRVSLKADLVRHELPGLWQVSRVAQLYLEVKHPLSRAPALAVPPMRTTAEAWAAYEQLKKRAAVAKKAADTARGTINAVLDEVAAVWDGGARVTSDGWTVGRREQLRFDAGLCRTLALQRGIDLTPVEQVVETVGHLVYVLVSPDDDNDEDDGQ